MLNVHVEKKVVPDQLFSAAGINLHCMCRHIWSISSSSLMLINLSRRTGVITVHAFQNPLVCTVQPPPLPGACVLYRCGYLMISISLWVDKGQQRSLLPVLLVLSLWRFNWSWSLQDVWKNFSANQLDILYMQALITVNEQVTICFKIRENGDTLEVQQENLSIGMRSPSKVCKCS